MVERDLCLGIGCTIGATPAELAEAVGRALASAGLHSASVAGLGTVDHRVDHPALRALAESLGIAVTGYPRAVLEAIAVPNPSGPVARLSGTGSVAEAAALAVAGPGGRLVLEKQIMGRVTVAAARIPE